MHPLSIVYPVVGQVHRNEFLALRKQEGVRLGRPKGSRNDPRKGKLAGKDQYIHSLLRRGIPQTKVAEAFHVHRNTLARFLKENPLRTIDAQSPGSPIPV